MDATYFVKFNSGGITGFNHTERFELKAGEYAVRMQLSVPDSVFEMPAIPTARVSIPAEQVRRVVDITSGEGEDL